MAAAVDTDDQSSSGGRSGIGLDAVRPGLTVVSCLYLALPYAIFFAGWLRWWVAVPALALVAAPCWELIRAAGRARAERSPEGTAPVVHRRQVLFLLVVAVALALVSGMGGSGYQDLDYPKHNAVLWDLIESPWPATLSSDLGSFPLVYYTAWYLPAAVVGKVAGWAAANHFLFAWGLLGLVLAILWYCLLAGSLRWVVVVAFFAFSGFDLVGGALLRLPRLLAGTHLMVSTVPDLDVAARAADWADHQITNWSGSRSWSYLSNLGQLFWVPQMALAGWIVTGMVLAAITRKGVPSRRHAVFLMALCSLWSPWVLIGLLPVLVVELVVGDRPAGGRLREWIGWPAFCGAGLLGLMALYYVARAGALPFSNDPSARFRFFGNHAWTGAEFAVRALLFFVLEAGVLAALIWWVRRPSSPRGRALFIASAAFLAVLPWFRYGYFNDLVMRVSLPSLMVLTIFLAKALPDRQRVNMKHVLLVAALTVAATTPLRELQRHVWGIARRGTLLAIPPPDRVRSLWELSCRFRDRRTGNLFFFRQYTGSRDSFFFRHLAREPSDGDSESDLH